MKKLFCVSGNRCAFPGCTSSLVDAASKVLIGEVCHIKAARPGFARYDPNQSDAERHGYDNLIIMCCNHHKIIDSDATTWTVQRLRDLKRQHESSTTPLPPPTPELVSQLLATVVMHQTNQVLGGSFITTFNQTGGQVAHQIVNQGEPTRNVPQAQWDLLVAILKQHAPEQFHITAPISMSEPNRLAGGLQQALIKAGWQSAPDSIGQRMGGTWAYSPGIIIATESDKTSVTQLAYWCGDAAGLGKITVMIGPLSTDYFPGVVNIFVGPML